MKILLVEDDNKIASLLEKGVIQAGHTLVRAASGEDALPMAQKNSFDVMIVDLMLPGMDGLAFIEQVRQKKKSWIPVLILSAKQSVSDRVKGLQAGGDDYLTKPFAFPELLARLDALTRRKIQQKEEKSISACGVHLDLLTRKVTRDDREIVLQPLEFQLLVFLVRHAGTPVSKNMIMEQVWNYDFDPHTNIIEVRMSSLRDKLEGPNEKKLIHTIRGIGYCLRE